MMIDQIDRMILEALQRDARMSLKELAALAGLSSPSVAERVRRLEERGVIRGFTVQIDPKALGYTIQAIVRVKPLPGKLHIVGQVLESIPEFVECDRVTGDDCYVARLFVRDIEQLDEILDRIVDRAETSTAIVKTQTITRRPPPLTSASE
jgi:Lrp/AsnC family leucine-responsive transcriptional regulator